MSADFLAVYDEHVWDVYAFLAYRLGNRDDAQDLTQLTFERALKAWPRFDPAKATPKTWLLAIARNLLIDHHRARRPTENLEDLGGREPVAEDSPDIGIAPELAAALAECSPRDREVLALRYGGDLTGPEIATELGLTLANVQQILSRTLRRLRDRLDAAGVLGP